MDGPFLTLEPGGRLTGREWRDELLQMELDAEAEALASVARGQYPDAAPGLPAPKHAEGPVQARQEPSGINLRWLVLALVAAALAGVAMGAGLVCLAWYVLQY